jgi:hypothetical protein
MSPQSRAVIEEPAHATPEELKAYAKQEAQAIGKPLPKLFPYGPLPALARALARGIIPYFRQAYTVFAG